MEGKYHKKLSDAIKVLDDLTFQLEITTAEIAEDIINQAETEGKSIPASGKEFVLKVMIKKDKRYQKLRKGVIDAKYVVSVLRGFVKGIDSRGYNLSQICKLEEKKMKGEPTYYEQGQVEYGKSKKDQFKSVDKRVEEMGEMLDFGEGE